MREWGLREEGEGRAGEIVAHRRNCGGVVVNGFERPDGWMMVVHVGWSLHAELGGGEGEGGG